MQFPFLLAILLLIGLPARAEPIDSIAAIVNNEAITCYQVHQDTSDLLTQLSRAGSTFLPSTDALNERSLDARVVKTLQLQEARKLELKISNEELDNAIGNIAERNNLLPDQFKEALQQQGIDFQHFKDNMHDQLLVSKLINIGVRSKLQISEEAIQEYYRKYIAVPKARREVQLGQIFLSLPAEPSPELLARVRNRARSIRTQLDNGTSFAQLVAIYSESPDRQQQGVMGWFTKGSITQRFAPALELPVNSVADPIRSPSGFHILKVLDERWKQPEALGESYDEAHARHILLRIPASADAKARAKIKQRAEDIANEMQGSSDEAFATRAKEISQGPSASRGGDLNWFKKGAMVPEFEKAVFALQPGQTSGVVKTKFGLHIIRLIARRHVDPNSLQANRDKITQILSGVEMQEQMPRWIASLRADADIQYKPCPTITTDTRQADIRQQPLPSTTLDVELKTALEQWRQAWSNQDIDAYFATYSDHFNAGKQFASPAAWKAARAQAIGSKQHISIAISNIKISHLEQGRARIEFNQQYTADAQTRHDRKLLLMEHSPAGWKIVREMLAATPTK